MESRTRFAVLGALAEGPRSVYTIKQDLEATVGHFWHESFGQLYPVLRQLTAAGWVVLQEEGGPRDRKIYALTPQGHDALRSWLEDPGEYLPPPRNEFLLKLFFGRHVPRAHSLARLRRYAERLRATQATYEAIERELLDPAAEDENQAFWLATLRHGQRALQGGLAWCEETQGLLAAPNEARQQGANE